MRTALMKLTTKSFPFLVENCVV